MHEQSITPEQLRGPGPADGWWHWALLGALSMVAGVIVLIRPGDSLTTLSVIMGAFILIDGALDLLSAFGREGGGRLSAALMGVLGIVFGLLLVRHPAGGVAAAGLLVGIWLVAAGAVRLAWAIQLDRRPWPFVVGAVQVIAGIVIVASPGIGVATLAILAGISFLLYGVVVLALALGLRAGAAEPVAPA